MIQRDLQDKVVVDLVRMIQDMQKESSTWIETDSKGSQYISYPEKYTNHYAPFYCKRLDRLLESVEKLLLPRDGSITNLDELGKE